VPYHLRVDASTACQLRCPGCPTTEGKVREGLATGLLSAAALQRLLDENPQVGSLELSNWGEIFLNPELPDLLRIAWKRRVDITAANGVNLNSASPEALKAVVAYRVRALTCSIDAATPEVYQQYRRRGHLPRVLENIRHRRRGCHAASAACITSSAPQATGYDRKNAAPRHGWPAC